MRTEMAVESLLELVEQSGVIAGDQMQQLIKEFRGRRPKLDSSKKIADELVARGMLTRWQAEQLLHGKHRGFFLGPYRILDLLGSGGMGSVYLAEHQMMRRRCAVKVLPPKQSKRESSTVDRFYREAQAVAALDHPNIVRAYDVNKARIDETEVHYLVMEHIDGQDLQRMVERQGKLEYRQAADFIRQAAKGLAHAHQRGLVHRDIKPANLIFDPQGVVKILDLGLACCFNDDADATGAAQPGKGVAGTADYVAPEQTIDSQNVDSRTDIYSLGQTFYFLLTGHPPFPNGTVRERLRAHQTKSPEPITNTRPDAPPALLAIIEKMTAKQPDQRYPSADQVVDALEAWLGESADEGSLRASAAEAAEGVVGPSSSDVPTQAVKTALEGTDLELAPLEDDEPPPSEQAGDAASKDGRRTPPRGDAQTASDSRVPSTPPSRSSLDDTQADREGPGADGLSDLPPLEKDLVTALEENDLMSELLAGELPATPLPGQGPLGSPSLKKPTPEPALGRLLELPAFWISLAGLVVVMLIVGIVLSVSSTDASGKASQNELPQDAGPAPRHGTAGTMPAPHSDQTAGLPQAIRPAAKPQVIVPVGSTWRWLHPTDGVDPATRDADFHSTFFTVDYDDSHWQQGQDAAGPEGGFGYGDPVRATFDTPATEDRKTAYFRHRFTTQVAMKSLVISLQRDDGVIIYLDGQEVGRNNVGSGKEAYDLFAEEVISGNNEAKVNRFELTGFLAPGEHVLAISLHNRPGGSSDLRIAEISLQGIPATSSPP